MCLTITLRSLIAGACWITGAVLAVVNVFYVHHLGAVAMVFITIAATMTVRSGIDRHAANWQAAYGAGREVAKIRQIR